MSKAPFPADHVDATPTPEGGETTFQDSDPALRLALGRYTLDLVARDGQLHLFIGAGVGRDRADGPVDPALAWQLVAAADRVDERAAIETSAWPLTATTDQ